MEVADFGWVNQLPSVRFVDTDCHCLLHFYYFLGLTLWMGGRIQVRVDKRICFWLGIVVVVMGNPPCENHRGGEGMKGGEEAPPFFQGGLWLRLLLVFLPSEFFEEMPRLFLCHCVGRTGCCSPISGRRRLGHCLQAKDHLLRPAKKKKKNEWPYLFRFFLLNKKRC